MERYDGCINAEAAHEGWVVAHGRLGYPLGVALRLLGRDAGLQAGYHAKVPRGGAAGQEFFRLQAQGNP